MSEVISVQSIIITIWLTATIISVTIFTMLFVVYKYDDGEHAQRNMTLCGIFSIMAWVSLLLYLAWSIPQFTWVWV